MATSIVISQLKQKRDEIQCAIYELEIKLAGGDCISEKADFLVSES
jgi:hypothetical protein